MAKTVRKNEFSGVYDKKHIESAGFGQLPLTETWPRYTIQKGSRIYLIGKPDVFYHLSHYVSTSIGILVKLKISVLTPEPHSVNNVVL